MRSPVTYVAPYYYITAPEFSRGAYALAPDFLRLPGVSIFGAGQYALANIEIWQPAPPMGVGQMGPISAIPGVDHGAPTLQMITPTGM